MRHRASRRFGEAYDRLPEEVRQQADRAYRQLRENPAHPSLHFKPAGRFWSVRVGLAYRALGVKSGDDLVWFWIGTHAEYDRLLS